MKHVLLVIPFFILDFTQFMLALGFWGLQFITPWGGGAAGLVVGASYCYNASTGVISGLLEGLKCAVGGALVGAGASALAGPIGMVVDTALSITVGGALILFLAFSGMFYPKKILGGFIGEALPFFNFLPIWTGIAIACILEKNKEEGKSSARMLGALVGMAKGGAPGAVGALAKASPFMNRARGRLYGADNAAPQESAPSASSRAPMLPNRFADIRPAAKGAVLALLLLVGTYTHAQVVPEPVRYVVAPETPGPREAVLIEVQGVGSFLGSATVTWMQDGKVVKTGVGERTYSFTTGAIGTKTTVRVSVDSSQGTFVRTFTFSPSLVNLLWEADTTVPPLYRGKALYSAGSPLKVLAFPSVYSGNARVLSSALSFQWSRAETPVPEQSGLGRSTFSFVGDQLQAAEVIAVEVYYGADKVARGEIAIPATDPQVVLYQRDALRGVIYDSAIPSSIRLVGKELTIQAEPYFFASTAKRTGQLSYVWTLDGAGTTGPDAARGILTLRQTGTGQGSVALGLTIQNNSSDQFVQTAQTALQLLFGTQSQSLLNLFGI